MKIIRSLSVLLSTGFGIGYLPFAPGTCGTLLAVTLAYFFWPPQVTHQLIACAGLILLAWIAITLGLPRFPVKDPKPVVIDEILGYAVTMIAHPAQWEFLIAAFVLFRLFDIAKPPPIRQSEKLPGALGVMMDDLLAGIAANLVVTGMFHLLIKTGWWAGSP